MNFFLIALASLTVLPLSAGHKVFPLPSVPEPSGIVFHESRNTLFVVGDRGNICEVTLKGKELHCINHGYDFEGLTVDPKSGQLFAVDETEALLIQIDPETLELVDTWSISRKYQGEKVLKKGRNGIEGLTMTRGKKGALKFFAVIQSKKKSDNPSALIQFKLKKNANKLKLTDYVRMDVTDLAGIVFEPSTETLFVLSDDNSLVLEVTTEGEILFQDEIEGENQEGIAFDKKGNLYIAQDSGGVLRIKDYLATRARKIHCPDELARKSK